MTTSSRPAPEARARARQVAARCGAPWVERRSLRPDPAELRYVVTREREHLARGSERWFVHEGLLRSRLAAGPDHPLLRAVGPARLVVDGTLGGATDAVHLAAALGCRVVGFEASPALFSLAEEGLPRLARAGWPAARVEARLGSSRAGPPCADVVYVDPLFPTPARSAPGFALLREVAVREEFDADWLAAACAAAPRVVLKVAAGAPAPHVGAARVAGGAVDYLVWGTGPT